MRERKLVVILLSCLFALTLTVVTFAQPKREQLPQGALPSREERAGVRLISFPAEGSGDIVYELSEAAQVRIRINIKSNAQAVLRTLLDWEKRPAGENKESWDGKDSAGNPIDLKNFMITIKRKPSAPGKLDIKKNKATVAGIIRLSHDHHAPEKCRELSIKITSPTNKATLNGLARVTVKLRGEHRGYSDKGGNGLRVFLNYHPEPIKEAFFARADTFTWLWDTTIVPNGEHILTVNVCDRHDHVEVDALRVNIQN